MKHYKRNVSPMSNEARNTYVVEHITNALISMLHEKPLNEISISEICDSAGVGRVSFYRNFKGKEEVLKRYLGRLFEEWKANYDGVDAGDFVESIFAHCANHKDIFITLYRRGLSYLSLESLLEMYGPKPDQQNMVAYTTAYLSYGLYGWLEEWFRRGMKETPREMAELMEKVRKYFDDNNI